MKQKISIALATYNGEKYLLDQLNSFIRQTNQPDELILCDDQSTDSTVNIIRNFSDTAPFKVDIFINEKRLGYAQNFSKALSLCTGDYIFLSDQDDVWHPKKIEHMLSTFQAYPKKQLLIHDIEFCKENLEPIGQTKLERMRKNFNLQKAYNVGMATAIRKRFLKLCLPVPSHGDVAHDTWLHQCADAVNGKRIIRDVLAWHRRHASNKTSTKLLNVDYVVRPYQYAIQEVFRIINKKSVLTPLDTNLLKWLTENKSNLVLQGLLNEKEIEASIVREKSKIDFMSQRLRILSMSKLKRPPYVIKLVLAGGYRDFKGWRSVARDLFLI